MKNCIRAAVALALASCGVAHAQQTVFKPLDTLTHQEMNTLETMAYGALQGANNLADLPNIAASRVNLFANVNPGSSGQGWALPFLSIGTLANCAVPGSVCARILGENPSNKLVVAANSNAIVGVADNAFTPHAANQPAGVTAYGALEAGSYGNLFYGLYAVGDWDDAGGGWSADIESHNYAVPADPALPAITNGNVNHPGTLILGAGGPYSNSVAMQMGFPGRGISDYDYGVYGKPNAIADYGVYIDGSLSGGAAKNGYWVSLAMPALTPNAAGTQPATMVADNPGNGNSEQPRVWYLTSIPAGVGLGSAVTATSATGSTLNTTITELHNPDTFFATGGFPKNVEKGLTVTMPGISCTGTVSDEDQQGLSVTISAPCASNIPAGAAFTVGAANYTTARAFNAYVTTLNTSVSGGSPASIDFPAGSTLNIGPQPYDTGYTCNPLAALQVGDGISTADNSLAPCFQVLRGSTVRAAVTSDGTFFNTQLNLSGESSTIEALGGSGLALATTKGTQGQFLNTTNPTTSWPTFKGSAGAANVQLGIGGSGAPAIEIVPPLQVDGALTLAGAPTATNQAATKGYVDGAIAGGGGSAGSPYQGFVLLTSSGSWTVPAGVSEVDVTECGGGSGAGGAGATSGAGAATGGSGVCVEFLASVTSGGAMAYTIGAGGTGGAAGANTGTGGGNTAFDGITAQGGIGGNGSSSGLAAATTLAALNAIQPNAVPSASLEIRNVISSTNFAGSATGKTGPVSIWGMGGVAGNAAAGGNATGYGAGGGAPGSTGTAEAGGNGSPGAIVIRY